MKISVYDIARRSKTVQKASSQPLLDCVFTVLHYNNSQRLLGPGPYAPEILWEELSQSLNATHIASAEKLVAQLQREALKVGDQLYYRNSAYEQMQETWKRNNPGFTEETYSQALGYAIRVMR
ncbi:hypothetical protein [Pseudomonas luteola]|uniref:hypothetical protein n=1 Tax=Pseudomonas luteola TaxID=47886 RepID=UPI000F775D89|nr:hypothetical protein [Pseudomonas luteola]